MSIWNWLGSHRGQVMDLLVFLGSLFLLGPFANLLQRLGEGFAANDAAAARSLSWLLLAAFGAYILGAILKRAPLHARVHALPSPSYAGCLVFAWITLHIPLSILGASIVAVGFDANPNGIALAAVIVLMLLPTFFAVRVIFRPKKLAGIPAWRKTWTMEMIADVLIVSAVIMLTVMWNIWIADVFFVTWQGHAFADRLFAAALAAVAFALFYVAPRFLFLIEDFNRWPTWATIGLTFAPLVVRILLGSAPSQ